MDGNTKKSVKCVDTSCTVYLTHGKIYDVIREDTNYFYVISDNQREGGWDKCRFEVVPQKLKLNYPIKYRHKDYLKFDGDSGKGIVYRSNQDKIVVLHVDNQVSTCWSEEDVERFITEGTWIVEASGPEALKPVDGSHKASQNGAEQLTSPSSPSNDVASLTIKIDSGDVTEALESVQKLTEALKECRRELKRFQRG